VRAVARACSSGVVRCREDIAPLFRSASSNCRRGVDPSADQPAVGGRQLAVELECDLLRVLAAHAAPLLTCGYLRTNVGSINQRVGAANPVMSCDLDVLV
jgi:hypothetical protein